MPIALQNELADFSTFVIWSVS